MTDITSIVQTGGKLGLEGDALNTWVKEQQDEARNQRTAEREIRELERLKVEAEKLKAEAEAIRFKESKDLEEKKLEIEKANIKENRELEEKRLELEKQKLVADEKLQQERLKMKRERLELDTKKVESQTNISEKACIPIFDETKDDFDAYLSRFESFAKRKKWPKTDWAMQLSLLLTGKTLNTVYGLPQHKQHDYDEVKDTFMRKFSFTEEGFRRELFCTKMGEDESPAQFMTRLDRLCQRWVKAMKIEMTFDGLRHLIVREEFFKRCHDDLVAYMRDKSELDIWKVATTAQHYLDSYGGLLSTKRLRRRQASNGSSEIIDERYCDICKRSGHISSTCWYIDQKENVKLCFKCGSAQHMIKECPQKSVEIGSSVIAMDNRQKGVSAKKQYPGQRYRDWHAEEISERLNVPISEGKVNGREAFVMRDSGCGFAAVRATYVKPEQYLNEYEDLLLMDCTPRTFQKATVFC